ncbi:MAG TPA: hypothetical protein VJQ56_05375 [Blastocatellia bacterium]|nr:hypothetical protein [Blastocatellia bacterium]
MHRRSYNTNVFINCPFDEAYKPLFNAMVFAIFDCGFCARCTLEEDDGSQIRVHKIYELISECRLGIHDLSRAGIDKSTRLPRFNMPLELGISLGAKYFGGAVQRRNACLILDSEKYRYQKFISDIAGQDIQAHDNDPRKMIRIVRNWLMGYSQHLIPGGSVIWNRYKEFNGYLPKLCKESGVGKQEIIYKDYARFVSIWIKLNPRGLTP